MAHFLGLKLPSVAPQDGASDDDLLLSQGCCPGCQLPTAFQPDDPEDELGGMTCRYCGTRFVLELIGEAVDGQREMVERLEAGARRQLRRIDVRETRVEPPEWTERKAAVLARVDEIKRRRGG